MLIILNKHSVN